MRKTAALAVSVIMSFLLVSCANGDSSSQSDAVTSSASESIPSDSSAPDSTPEDSSEPEPEPDPLFVPTGAPGEYTTCFNAKLAEGKYTVEYTIKSGAGTSAFCSFMMNGGRYKVKAMAAGLEAEVYVIDGKTSVLIPSVRSYLAGDDSKLPDLTILGVRDLSLDSRAELLDSGEEEGMPFELYGVPISTNTPEGYKFNEEIDTKVCYYYDKTTCYLKKIVYVSPLTGSNTITIGKLRFTADEITLPDTTGWTPISDSTELDRTTKIKMTLSELGVTDEMLQKSGYTLEQLAALTDSEFAEKVAIIIQENS